MTDSPLRPLEGRWATTITMLHPAEAKGQVYHAVDSYRFLPGDRVMVHEVEARMGEAIASVEIYTPAEKGDGFVSRNFDGRGQLSDYTAGMKAGVWSVTGESETFTSTRLEADVIEGLWRLKDGEDWVDWMTVTLDRVA